MNELSEEIKIRQQAFTLLLLVVKRINNQMDYLAGYKKEAEDDLSEYHNIWHQADKEINSLKISAETAVSSSLKGLALLSSLVGGLVVAGAAFVSSLKFDIDYYFDHKKERDEEKQITIKENERNLFGSKISYLKSLERSVTHILNIPGHFEFVNKLKNTILNTTINDFDNDHHETRKLLQTLGIPIKDLIGPLSNDFFAKIFKKQETFLSTCQRINKYTDKHITLQNFLNHNTELNSAYQNKLNNTLIHASNMLLSNMQIIKLSELIIDMTNEPKFKLYFNETVFDTNIKDIINKIRNDVILALENNEQSGFSLDFSRNEKDKEYKRQINQLFQKYPAPKKILRQAVQGYQEEAKKLNGPEKDLKLTKAYALKDYEQLISDKTTTAEERKKILLKNHPKAFDASPEYKRKNILLKFFSKETKMDEVIHRAETSYQENKKFYSQHK